MSRRSDVLELAVLGLLTESPLHGYELRKRLKARLGALRAFSYGSLYPCLRSLVAAGWILAEDESSAGNRGRIVYTITADGKEHFAQLLAATGPATWEDDNFRVRLAFFARTDAAVRLRILQGRRSRLEERLATVHVALARTRERVDRYTLELQRHGLESVEREVRWLDELIASERHQSHGQGGGTDAPARPGRPT